MEKECRSKNGISNDGNKGKQNGAGKARFPRKCLERGKRGHRARDSTERKKKGSTSGNALVTIENTTALATDATATASKELWVLDPGTGEHVTGNVDGMTNLNEA